MSSWVRRLVLVFLVAGAFVGLGAAPAAARSVPVVDGIQLRYLPPRLGQPSDFAYHFERVDFTSRVWETQAADGAWSVDLDVTVMRGKRLTDGRALRDWFIRYEQRPPAEARYHRVTVHGRPGWRCRDQVFWLVRRGLAVSVQLDRTKYSRHQVHRVAWAARPVRN